MTEVTSVEHDDEALSIGMSDGGIFSIPLKEGMDVEELIDAVTNLKNQVEDYIVNGEEYD